MSERFQPQIEIRKMELQGPTPLRIGVGAFLLIWALFMLLAGIALFVLGILSGMERQIGPKVSTRMGVIGGALCVWGAYTAFKTGMRQFKQRYV